MGRVSADVLPLGDGAGAGWAQVPRPKNQGAGGGTILSRGWGMGSAEGVLESAGHSWAVTLYVTLWWNF